jgi:uncharacterized protein YndB with AHSA1/START domain
MSPGLHVARSVVVQAPSERVLAAFFDPQDLARWWRAIRSVTVPRPLGPYAIEWAESEFDDELLGRLGGTFHGTVMDFHPGKEFFLADAYWNPPAGESIGPMALEVRCVGDAAPGSTRITIDQRGEDEGPRWQRYFHVAAAGWQVALDDLRKYLEHSPART